MIEEGLDFAAMMYTWRGISTCLPLSQGNEDPNRGEIHQKTVEILKPQIQGIYDMVEFVQEQDGEGECQEKTKIFFLKTHKCASSSLQNIFLRFGEKRNLSFVLPLERVH